MFLDICDVRPNGRRTGLGRKSPSLEKNGAAHLADEREPPKRPWVVRIYYVSMADERCCAEFGGLTEPEAVSLASSTALDCAHGRVPGQRWALKSDPIPPRAGWREVEFPSEHARRHVSRGRELLATDAAVDCEPPVTGADVDALARALDGVDGLARPSHYSEP
jgi:hypothetical protein